MTTAWPAGPLTVAALVLVAAGVAKLVRPADTARALRAARLPGSVAAVRAGAAAEVAIGALAIATGRPEAAMAVVLSYVAFAAFVGAALQNDWPLATCGCFGEPDTAPHPVHVVADLVLALAAVPAVAITTTAPVAVAEVSVRGAAAVGLVAAATALATLALGPVPRLLTDAGAASEAVLGVHHTGRRLPR